MARRSAATSSSCAGKAMRLATWLRADGRTTRASVIRAGILRCARAAAGRPLAPRGVLLHRPAGLGQARSITNAESGAVRVNPRLITPLAVAREMGSGLPDIAPHHALW